MCKLSVCTGPARPSRAGATTKTSASGSDSRYSVGYFISFTLPKATVTGVHEIKGRYNPLDAKQHSVSGCSARGPARPRMRGQALTR